MVIESLFKFLPSSWQVTTLGEACVSSGGNIQTGPFGSQLHASDYVPFGIPSIMPQNIGDNRVLIEGIARITPEDAARLSRYLVTTGDIVYSRRGDVERRALIRVEEDGWLCGTGCLRVRFGNSKIDPLYASYYLGHPSVREWIVRHAIGATMPNLNTSILSALPFVIPPPFEQKAIAHILGTLDDKIELNREMNQTLEAMARAIFKSWFVDFDPVRAKMEGRQPAGMDAATAELFPDKFEESALGMIPGGWKVGTLGNVCLVKGGFAYKSKDFTEKGYPVIKIKNINEDKTVNVVNLEYIPEKIALKTRDFWLNDGDLVMAMTGATVGKYGLILNKNYSKPCLLNQRVAKLSPLEKQSNRIWFVYCALSTYDVVEQIISTADGSAQPNISAVGIMSAKMQAPPDSIITQFNITTESLFQKILVNRLESDTLASIRDTLLPKLLSGEIRVKEAEKVVETVL